MRLDLLGVRGSTGAPGAEFARYGGHTSCVALTAEGADRPSLVFDAGTGLRTLTKVLAGDAFDGSIVLSHLHWDHVQGLPFFAAGDREDSRVDLYLPEQDGRSGRDLLAQTLSPPAFPITPEGLRGTWGFHALPAGRHTVEGFAVEAVDIEHKGGRTFGLRVEDAAGSLAYLPDHAPAAGVSDELTRMLSGVDVLVHDAQFLEGERPVAVDYGHATVQDAVSARGRVRRGHADPVPPLPGAHRHALDEIGGVGPGSVLENSGWSSPGRATASRSRAPVSRPSSSADGAASRRPGSPAPRRRRRPGRRARRAAAEEVVAAQRHQPGGFERGDRGRPGHVAEQGDLAEGGPGTQPAYLLAVAGDGQAPAGTTTKNWSPRPPWRTTSVPASTSSRSSSARLSSSTTGSEAERKKGTWRSRSNEGPGVTGARVELAQRGPGERAGRREQQPGDGQGPADPEARQPGAAPRPRRRPAPRSSAPPAGRRPGRARRRNGALQQGPSRQVEERLACAGGDQQDDCCSRRARGQSQRRRGSPAANMPASSAGASRRRPTSTTVPSAPRSAPTPRALPRTPGPEGPVSSTSSASTIRRMSIRPTTTYWPVTMTSAAPTRAARRSSRTPSRAAVTIPSPLASPSVGTRATGRPTTRSAAPASRIPNSRKTDAGPSVANIRPQVNGPKKAPAPSAVIEAELPAIRSAGVCAIAGIAALCTGRVRVIAQVTRTPPAQVSTNGASASRNGGGQEHEPGPEGRSRRRAPGRGARGRPARSQEARRPRPGPAAPPTRRPPRRPRAPRRPRPAASPRSPTRPPRTRKREQRTAQRPVAQRLDRDAECVAHAGSGRLLPYVRRVGEVGTARRELHRRGPAAARVASLLRGGQERPGRPRARPAPSGRTGGTPAGRRRASAGVTTTAPRSRAAATAPPLPIIMVRSSVSPSGGTRAGRSGGGGRPGVGRPGGAVPTRPSRCSRPRPGPRGAR